MSLCRFPIPQPRVSRVAAELGSGEQYGLSAFIKHLGKSTAISGGCVCSVKYLIYQVLRVVLCFAQALGLMELPALSPLSCLSAGSCTGGMEAQKAPRCPRQCCPAVSSHLLCVSSATRQQKQQLHAVGGDHAGTQWCGHTAVPEVLQLCSVVPNAPSPGCPGGHTRCSKARAPQGAPGTPRGTTVGPWPRLPHGPGEEPRGALWEWWPRHLPPPSFVLLIHRAFLLQCLYSEETGKGEKREKGKEKYQ